MSAVCKHDACMLPPTDADEADRVEAPRLSGPDVGGGLGSTPGKVPWPRRSVEQGQSVSSMATAKNLDVFISYAHSEVGLAHDLRRRLSLAGVTSFVAADDVQIGDNLNDRLEQAIQEADVVVVLCSGAWSKSQWVKSEIALAVERGLRGGAGL